MWSLVRYTAARVGSSVATLLAASCIIFVLLDTAPGNAAVLGSGGEGSQLNDSAVAARTHEFGLARGVFSRYVTWLAGAFQGDLGQSIQSRMPVTSLLADRAPVTVELTTLAMFIAMTAGLFAGYASARWPGADRIVVSVTSLESAVPHYASGTMLVALLAVRLGWVPSFGAGGRGLMHLADRLTHLALPGILLGLGASALIARMTRASLADSLTRSYAQLATARGIIRPRVILRHAAPTSWQPVATVIGLEMAALLGGTALTETLFALPGLGRLLVTSVQTKDFAVVQPLVLLSLMLYLFVTLIIDLVDMILTRHAYPTGATAWQN